MKSQILITTQTHNAYRAIRTALVNAKIGDLGVSGMTFSAIIDFADYALLVNIIRTETARASVLPSEHTITTAQQFIPITSSSRQTATLSLAEESSPSRHPASSRAAIAAATAERISLFTVFFIFNHFTTLTLSVNSTPCSSRTRSK